MTLLDNITARIKDIEKLQELIRKLGNAKISDNVSSEVAFVQKALIQVLVIELCKLYDQDKNAASLTKAINTLGGKWNGKKNSKNIYKNVVSDPKAELLSRVSLFGKSRKMRRMFNLRDKQLAHLDVDWQKHYKKVFVIEIENSIKFAKWAVRSAYLLHSDCSYIFNDVQEFGSELAEKLA